MKAAPERQLRLLDLQAIDTRLSQRNRCCEAGGATTDDDDVVFHGFTRAELLDDFFRCHCLDFREVQWWSGLCKVILCGCQGRHP